MLTRRHIRIKVLQALYGFTVQEDKDMARSLDLLKKSLDGIYDLYLYEIKTMVLVLRAADKKIELNRAKQLVTKEDLNPNLRFSENIILRAFADNTELNAEFENRGIKWGEHKGVFSKILRELQDCEEYDRYMVAPTNDVRADKRIVKYLYGTYIAGNERLHEIYEEKSMHWADDLDAAQMMVVKTIKVLMDINGQPISKVNFSHDDAEKVFKTNKLPKGFNPKEQRVTVKLFKDKSDKDFGPTLFAKTLNAFAEHQDQIIEKTKNWDVDRIAILDNLLMQMAQTELEEFSEIPIRVSLNEYIELSKMYSTPKSGQFINGVLDKISLEMQKSGKIKKMGRGLA